MSDTEETTTKDKKPAKKIFKTLEELKQSFNKSKPGTILQGNSIVADVEVVRTNIASFDASLGVLGIPRGRVIEIFGPESSGKTTVALQVIAAYQKTLMKATKRKGTCMFIDVEHALDPVWAGKIGVDRKALLMSQPDSGEEALQIVKESAQSGLVDLIVIDSVAALVPQKELDGEVGDSNIGGQARLMSSALRTLSGICSKTGTTIIFINQIRQKIGVMFGSNETTSGGNALKFYASVRISIRRRESIKIKDLSIGHKTVLKIIKNKCAPPFTTCEFDICYGNGPHGISGIDKYSSLLDVAPSTGVLKVKGSNYYYKDANIGNGSAKALVSLRDPKLFESVLEDTYKALKERAVSTNPSDDEESTDEDTEETVGVDPDEGLDDDAI